MTNLIANYRALAGVAYRIFYYFRTTKKNFIRIGLLYYLAAIGRIAKLVSKNTKVAIFRFLHNVYDSDFYTPYSYCKRVY